MSESKNVIVNLNRGSVLTTPERAKLAAEIFSRHLKATCVTIEEYETGKKEDEDV